MTEPNPLPRIPSAAEVNAFHEKCDVDTSPTSQHHTTGQGHNQASPGDHTHNGKNSKRIGAKLSLSFPTTANAAYVQADFQKVIDALRALGFGT